MDSSSTRGAPNSFLLVAAAMIALSATTSFRPSAASDGFWPLAYKHVVIINHVGIRDTLSVHCRFKSQDLGLQIIPFGAQWEFKFHVNLFKTTKYTCHFVWSDQAKYFDIFAVWRDDDPFGHFPECRHCVWSIHSYGPCRLRSDQKPSLCFGWE